ncbi:DUF4145 domain-containing protein [Micromonospora nigra]|uniref:DUF4145 domain-containing protein n=1 Tax=Micromonospora nigra TaxID=145857 RepID=UPI001C31BC26|nr:DUF4145 domain-containing protein [Micromonospora nigra]
MLTDTCPRCRARSLFEVVWIGGSDWGWQGTTRYHAALVCVACGRPVAGLTDQAGKNIFRLWVDRVDGKEFPDVPSHIAETADEAYRCHSIEAYRAAVLLARSVIEATAKEKGITSGPLLKKIDEMFDQRLIREHVRDGAHEVRHLGNDMAHGDFITPVQAEESSLILTLMGEVLEEIFQSVARVQRARELRAAKAAETGS